MPPELSGGIVFVGPTPVGRACRESRRDLGTVPNSRVLASRRELGTVPNPRHRVAGPAVAEPSTVRADH